MWRKPKRSGWGWSDIAAAIIVFAGCSLWVR
jgi:hypothetical protein